MEYIVIFENDHKDDTHMMYLCQYTGYEERLRKLCEFMIENQKHGDFGDGYSYSYCETRLPEHVVDAMECIRTAGITNIRCWRHDNKTAKNAEEYEKFFTFVKNQIIDLNQSPASSSGDDY
jgi:hypothetical protein